MIVKCKSKEQIYREIKKNIPAEIYNENPNLFSDDILLADKSWEVRKLTEYEVQKSMGKFWYETFGMDWYVIIEDDYNFPACFVSDLKEKLDKILTE